MKERRTIVNTALTDSGAPPRGAVVITGASTGIGRACALALDALGFRVFAGVRKAEDGESLRRASSARLTPIFIDVTDEQSIAAAAEEVSREVGEAGLVGLVNNAGIAIPGPLEYLPLEELRRQLEINLVGQLAVTQAFLPLLRRGRGRMVNISSLAGKLTTPFNGAYSAAKHGIEAFSDALRMELAPWGIHVSVVEPGTIATAMPKKLLRDANAVLNNLPAEGRERYGSDFETYVRTLAEHAQSGSQPEVVARAIVHALTARTPRARYPAGAPAGRMLMLYRLLPDRLLDRVILRFLGLPRAFGVRTDLLDPASEASPPD
jgi:NAD(P)-dependent dehydrogenase (short-subunit alcohol dehydrogenase family)